MRDYVCSTMINAKNQIADLKQQEKIIREAKGNENRERRNNAEEKVKGIRETLRNDIPPAVLYEFLDKTGQTRTAGNFRTHWQKQSLHVNCLRELDDIWKKGSTYYKQVFETPKVDLNIFPAYSFFLQFTFILAQPYISRDEQDFYMIDNPIRKDKLFGLPYVASTSWKGSLRAALWQLEHIAKKPAIKYEAVPRLFGNDRNELDQEKLHAGRLLFFPTFFTEKSLEIINPQDRKQRTGSLPIPFESVPLGATGIFTLLYVPFDCIGESVEEIAGQVADDMEVLAKGLQAMFCAYGFGAKTHSGFGLAKETVQEMSLQVRAAGIQKLTEKSLNFEQLLRDVEKLALELRS